MEKRIDFAFLDSGTGGIPYMKELKKKSPLKRCVYVGDTKNFPYGEKSSEEIIACSAGAIEKIVEKWNPKSVIIACNTISVTALDKLRVLFPDLPIIGTVPAIKLAAKVTENKKIGLLATNAAVNHPYSDRLIRDFASECQVFKRGDPELISFIEHDLFTATAEEKLSAVKPAVDFFKSCGCDTIILGCTHFTHIADIMTVAAGSGMKIVDSRDGVARHALEVLEEKESAEEDDSHSIPSETLPQDTSFFITGYKTKSDEVEYKTLCEKFGIPWCGLMEI